MVYLAYILQFENATNKLIDYGILGIVLLFVAFFAYKMYEKINEDQKIWRNEAIESRKDLIGLSIKQNELNSRLIDIREKDVEQNKENFHDIKKHLEKLPENIRRELQVDLMQACKGVNKTSAG